VYLCLQLDWTYVAHKLLVKTWKLRFFPFWYCKVYCYNLISVWYEFLHENVGSSPRFKQSFDVVFLSLHRLVLKSESGGSDCVVVVKNNI
jgi:hypothetical protein